MMSFFCPIDPKVIVVPIFLKACWDNVHIPLAICLDLGLLLSRGFVIFGRHVEE